MSDPRAVTESTSTIAREQAPTPVNQLDDEEFDRSTAADDCAAHTFGGLPPGREPLKEAMQRAGAGVSEPKFQILDVIAEKDRVAVRLTTRARHTGMFMGVEPSGNEYSIDEIHIFRIEDGKVLEHWHEFDRQRLMQQLESRQAKARPGIGARST